MATKKDDVQNMPSAIEQDMIQVETNNQLKESFSELTSDMDLEKKTQLTSNEIGKISILYTYASDFGFNELVELIENFLRYRVSLKRKGREELVKIASANLIREENMIKAHAEMDKRTRRG